MKPIYAYEISRVKSYEQDLMKYFEEYWIISEEDKVQLEAGSHFEKLHIVRNGVDTDYFNRKQRTTDNGQRNSIIFVGYMGVESSDAIFYFYNQILPLIKKEIPDFKWYIIGADPPDRVKSLANDKNIIVTGYVEDLRDWYEKASVAIAPMRFVAGMQNKILEAMSMSLPVVTTPYGNEGINGQNGEEIFVEDEPDHFARRIVQILRDNNLRKEMGNKGRRFVEEKYSWNVVMDRVEEIEKQISPKRIRNEISDG
jgi:glycosyltransferase involved in cell wall biosynthesis